MVYDTIVVGMGSAGTTAASTLAQAGKKVLALEAMDRIGGRVHTVAFGDGLVELGAEWIHGTSNSRVYDTAIANNIDVVNQTLDFQLFMSDGTLADNRVIGELMDFATEVMDDPPPQPEPLGQYITRRVTEHINEKYPQIANDTEFIDSFLFFMDLVTNTIEASNSWNDVTTFSNYEDLKGHQYASWHRYGYKTFFELLLNTYKNGTGYPNLEVKLNTEVSRIDWPQDPTQDVTVSCTDGSVYKARNVIVTVSLGVLKERHNALFAQKLPSEKLAAMENLSMGLIGKIILAFPSTWWSYKDMVMLFWSKSDRMRLADDVWISNVPGVSQPTGCDNCVTLWMSGNTMKLLRKYSITTPFHYRHAKLFCPELPQEKVTLINKLSIGVVDKIVLLFDKVWWPSGASFFGFLWDRETRIKMHPKDKWITRVYGVTCPLGNENALTFWTSGNCAKLVESLPDDVVKNKAMELLRRFMGKNNNIPEPTGMLRSSWCKNPYTRGSYTYDNLLTPKYPNARDDLGKPLLDSSGNPRVLFAGEATNPRHFSTVHGASETGYREAMRLLSVSSKI